MSIFGLGRNSEPGTSSCGAAMFFDSVSVKAEFLLSISCHSPLSHRENGGTLGMVPLGWYPWDLVPYGCQCQASPQHRNRLLQTLSFGTTKTSLEPQKVGKDDENRLPGGGNSNILFLEFSPRNFGEDEPNLTIVFFRWVVQPPTRN